MKFNLGILTNLLPGYNDKKDVDVRILNGVPVKTIEVGVAGTQIYGGYLNEDYQAQLHGRQWADKQDEMRRSDAQIHMMLSCIKLPIRSSSWVVKTLEDSPEAELQKRLYEKVLFEDNNKSWKRLIGEILTCVDFGFSLLEKTFRVKMDDPEFGTYNTIKSLGWRSQRTIERWIVDKDGVLQKVVQIAYGDTGRLDEMDAEFLIHFSPNMEGNNYEGISALRFVYGNWLRKNFYLRLMASGIEKYAIPTPILKTPAIRSEEDYAKAIKILKAYTSNQSNYLTFPEGWELTVQANQFDVEKMKTAIELEDQGIMNAALASFLTLGQGSSSGNRALGDTLSDFFKMSQQYLADHIAEQLDQRLFQDILDMNYGAKTKMLVKLECDGLSEQADLAWSEILRNLTQAGVVRPDQKLEEYVRDQYGISPIDESTQPEYEKKSAAPNAGSPVNVQMSEGKWPRKINREMLKKGFTASQKN